MQGKKDYQERLFDIFQLSERIPQNDFYRKLKGAIDLHFLYPLTKGYYGESTVEPVFGTLTQFMGLRKINTIGLGQANKVMHLSAIAYNLKKYLKFQQGLSKSGAGVLALAALVKRTFRLLFGAYIKHRKLAYNF